MNSKIFDGVHLFSDVDGTLSSTADYIPPRNLQALRYFVENGGTFSIATGRYIGDLAVLENVPINGLSILNNGSCLYDFIQGRAVETMVLTQDTVDFAVEFCKKHSDVGLLVVNDDGYITAKFGEEERPVLNARYPVCNLAEIKQPFYKLLYITQHNCVHDVYEKICGSTQKEADYVITGEHSIEAVTCGVSKGLAFEKICTQNNIDRAMTFFVGDSYNDISIMQVAGFSAAVADAHEDVKKNVDTVLCNFTDGALADMIELIEKKVARTNG